MAHNDPTTDFELNSLTRDELNIIAKKLNVKGYRKLTISRLIEELHKADPVQLKSALKINWLGRNRVRLIGWSSILLGIVGVIFTILSYYSTGDESARANAVAQIDGQRTELQTKLDDELEHSMRFVRGIERVVGHANTLAAENAEIRRNVTSLKTLLKGYDTRFGDKQASEADGLRIRLARATLANAERRYGDALLIITEEDVESHAAETATWIELEVDLRRIRADAFAELNQWEAALPHFERVAALKPSDVAARMGWANCLDHLNRYLESSRIWDGALMTLADRYRHVGQNDSAAEVATAFANRAGVLAEQGKRNEAITGLSTARDMFRRILDRQPTEKATADLGKTLTRLGDVLADQSRHKDAIAAYDEALSHYRAFKETSGADSKQVDAVLADTLHNRATLLIEQKHVATAVIDLNEAISLQRKFANTQSGAPEAGSLAASLTTRAIADLTRGELEDAEKYANEAIELLQRLVSDGKRTDLSAALAFALLQRSHVRLAMRRMRESADDLKTALQLYEVAYKQGRSELLDKVALCLAEYGSMLVNQHESFHDVESLNEAFKVLDRAATIYQKLIEGGRRELVPRLAVVLSLRATATGRQKDLEPALKDAVRAVEMLQPLVEHDRSDLRDDLVSCLANLGCVLADAGRIEDAIGRFGDALSIERELAKDGVKDREISVAVVLMLRGRVFANTGHQEEAAKDLAVSVSILTRHVDAGQDYLAPQLARAKRHLDLAEQGMHVD